MTMRTRLCLITPNPLPDGFAETLAAALDAGDVASLLIDPASASRQALDELIRIATSHDVATLIIGGPPVPAADGLHVDDGAKSIRAAQHAIGDGIIGVGGISSRHDAMTVGELLPDYLFFGRFEEENEPSIHPKAMELATWWAEVFQIPAMVMAGSDIEGVGEAAAQSIEFVALRNAVWSHPGGAATAVREVNAILDEKASG